MKPSRPKREIKKHVVHKIVRNDVQQDSIHQDETGFPEKCLMFADSSTLKLTYGQQTLTKEKCRIWFFLCHLCSHTSPSLMKAVFFFSCPFRR